MPPTPIRPRSAYRPTRTGSLPPKIPARTSAATPRYVYARVIATACAWWSGEHARAAGHVEALRGLAPTFTSSISCL